MFRRLPPQGGSPREVAEIMNGVLTGKTNNTGVVTLETGNATTTTLYDPLISRDSKIILLPASGSAFTDTAPYGEFSNNTGQLSSGAGVVGIVEFDATMIASGIYRSNTTRLNVRNAGIYDVFVSLLLSSSSNVVEFADIWYRVNGVDVPSSARKFFMPIRKSATEPSHIVGVLNTYLELEANDYVEIAGYVSSTSISLENFPADVVIPRPSIPAVIAKMSYIAPQAYSNVYITNQTNGQATINHWANSDSDKQYSYVVVA